MISARFERMLRAKLATLGIARFADSAVRIRVVAATGESTGDRGPRMVIANST